MECMHFNCKSKELSNADGNKIVSAQILSWEAMGEKTVQEMEGSERETMLAF